MNSRLAILIPILALVIGILIGIYVATSFNDPSVAPPPQGLQLAPDAQKDFIINVADAYAADANLKLAQDRLARLRDPNIAARVEGLAIEYASQQNSTAINLARLAVATGSQVRSFIALFVTATPSPIRTTPTTQAPVFSNVRATTAPTERATATRAETDAPVYVVVPNDNPVQVLPTNTPTITETPRPRTRVPASPTPTPTFTPAPPPPVIFEPGFPGGWPPGVYFQAANVQPGEKYWHLVKAVYCDFIEENFGCPDRPGNTSGTSIYVINGGAPIDVVRPDGVNVGGDPSQIGDLKAPNDPCECSWTMLVSDYRISVAGAPSDAIGGFSLYTVGGNVLAGHAHVRYFLYFDYITR